MNRDNLTEEQAKQRIEAQPSNETMVKESTVVFSTQWSYEFSRQQVIFSLDAIQFEDDDAKVCLIFAGGQSMEGVAGEVEKDTQQILTNIPKKKQK